MAAKIKDRLTRLLSWPYTIGKRTICVGVSIGYDVSACDDRLEDLVVGAGAALYAAKASGGEATTYRVTRVGKALIERV